jgi:hypothetical protein
MREIDDKPKELDDQNVAVPILHIKRKSEGG